VDLPERKVTDDRDCDERTIYYQDSDGDTFGADDHRKLACSSGAGWSTQGGDCDDTDASVTTECHEFDTGEPADTGPVDTGEPEDTAGADQ
jgi:hypothetical protein